ncbi:MAG TPA: DUF6498-containing protein [Gemmatimonadales bacterium]|nr:DUF6498-containing protein [Gemmatimonadales bacterium]
MTTPRLTPSGLVLVGANLVPLVGVLFFGWTVFATLLLFWAENAIVGAFNVLRMLVATPQLVAMWLLKLFMIPFFIVHYGMFVTVHGIFVLSIFGTAPTKGFPSLATFAHAIQTAGVAPAAWGLALSHAVSFGFNYIGTGEYRTVLLPSLMSRPYGRVMVLHVVILLGGFLVQLVGSPLIPLALLVVLKTGLDFTAHLREHAPRAAAMPALSA